MGERRTFKTIFFCLVQPVVGEQKSLPGEGAHRRVVVRVERQLHDLVAGVLQEDPVELSRLLVAHVDGSVGVLHRGVEACATEGLRVDPHRVGGLTKERGFFSNFCNSILYWSMVYACLVYERTLFRIK